MAAGEGWGRCAVPAGWGTGGGAWPGVAVATPTPVENTDEEEELEREQKAKNQRMDEWLRLQSRIHMSTDQRRAFLRAMALQFSGGSRVEADKFLLSCINNSEPVPIPPIRDFGHMGGRITSMAIPGVHTAATS